ncbi:ABC transporter substrate-binding protein [Poseidonocella sp. HB161398]|uniref:ABC transporter substrate-binding protein n=1 Tax=Poseidonocella sp. HB161398 TaxID=2320855 RepID=UPI0011096637|nr:ABC transporter substrate-binding protein [Poseidonocella sp. HB161398]
MTKALIDRRSVLAGGMGLALAAGFGPARAAGTPIRMVWWGNEERARRTTEAIRGFEAASDDMVEVATEYMGWDDYWTRLATQVAGGNAPDLIQMDYRYLFEYVGRGTLHPLDEYLGGALQIGDFGKANLDSCSVDGKLYGANVGVNAFGMLVDAAAWEEAGMEAPGMGTSWEAFAEACAAFKEATPRRRFYATADTSGQGNSFELWLRQRGKGLYTEAGELGYDADDAGEWFDYWAKLRKAKGCVPADVQAQFKNSLETSPITLGTAATDFAFSNQFTGYQAVNKAALGMTALPVLPEGAPGHYLKPSQMFVVSAKSKAPEAAARLANYLVRDPRGALILGLDRGVPASPAIREALLPELDEAQKKSVAFISELGDLAGGLPPAPPKGAGEAYAIMLKVSQEVAFGMVDPAEGGRKLVEDSASSLTR